MLLEFKTKNYKSFVEEARFSMVAAPKQSGLNYSVWNTKVKGKKAKLFCSSVIYGPNAEEKSSPNAASSLLELIPNNNFTHPEPVEFSVEFLENGYCIQYEIRMDLGVFLDEGHKRNILSETLSIDGKTVFSNRQKGHLYDQCY